ncbi:hypothetical protein ACM64Y_19715 [Novispirillum sp. DQ9]|uniref:hypothetical protein n=1 Tax=Novispirillum sp. DQ9 TaxID=3398612 RepID=UPI003C7B9548
MPTGKPLLADERVPAEFLGRWSSETVCSGVVIDVKDGVVELRGPAGVSSFPITDVCKTCAGGGSYADPLSCAGSSAYTGIEVQVSAGPGGAPASLLLRFNAREKAGDLVIRAVGDVMLGLAVDGKVLRRCGSAS